MKKKMYLLIVGILTFTSLTACGSKNTDTTKDQTATETTVDETDTTAKDDTAIMDDKTNASTSENDSATDESSSSQLVGKITAIDGNTITLSAMTMGGNSGEAPSGDAPAMPDGEAPSGDSSAMPDGEAPAGETQTITLTDTSIIYINGAEASISDLSVDNLVTVEMNGEEVVSITVMEQPTAAE